MFKVRIEYSPDNKQARVNVNYRHPNQMFGKTRTEVITAPLFGLIKYKAKATANRMVKEWRRELDATITYDEYEVIS